MHAGRLKTLPPEIQFPQVTRTNGRLPRHWTISTASKASWELVALWDVRRGQCEGRIGCGFHVRFGQNYSQMLLLAKDVVEQKRRFYGDLNYRIRPKFLVLSHLCSYMLQDC